MALFGTVIQDRFAPPVPRPFTSCCSKSSISVAAYSDDRDEPARRAGEVGYVRTGQGFGVDFHVRAAGGLI